jgi:hypothetical protein
MEKRLDPEQYVKDLEKHVNKLADDLVKARTLLELSLTVISPVDDTKGVKDSIEDYLYGATRNYVDQD